MKKLQDIFSADRNIARTFCIYIFVILSFMMGTYFIRNTSPLALPDADMHLYNTVAVAQGSFFINEHARININGTSVESTGKPSPNQPVVTLPQKFLLKNFKTLVTSDLLSNLLKGSLKQTDQNWQKKIGLLKQPSGQKLVGIRTQYPFIDWLPQAVGLNIATCSGVSNYKDLFLSIRVSNLVFYIIILSIALFLLPKGRLPAILLAANPYSIFIASSISADTFTIAIASLFIAYLCYLIMGRRDRKLTILERIFLIVLSLSLFLIKITYVPLLLLILLIPNVRWSLGRKLKYFFSLSIGGVTLFAFWDTLFLMTYTLPLIESSKNSKSIFNNFGRSLTLLFTELIPKDIRNWLGLAFTRSSHLIYQQLLYPFILVLALGFVSMAVFLIMKHRYNFLLMLVGLAAALLSLLLINFAELLTWTNTYAKNFHFNQIDGMQGRYYAPLVFLLLLPYVARHAKKKGGAVDED